MALISDHLVSEKLLMRQMPQPSQLCRVYSQKRRLAQENAGSPVSIGYSGQEPRFMALMNALCLWL